MKQFQPSESLAVGFLLALTGGLLDAYSYLNRGEVFATAETGNIVLMGINLAQQNWSGALHYLLPVLAFTAGILAAEWVRRRCDPGEGRPQRLHWRLPLLLAECVAILVVSALPMGPLDPLANIIISFASALQVESFRNIQGYGCVTTMCTGNLRSGTENLFHWLSRREPKAPPKMKVYYGLILCFILGAVVSGLLSLPAVKYKTAVGALSYTSAAAAAFILIDKRLAAAVLFLFARAGAAAHAYIFYRTAKSRHLMSLKMCQTDEHIRIHNGMSDSRFLHINTALYRNRNVIRPLQSVADKDGTFDGQRGKPVLPRALQMLQRILAASRIHRITVGQKRLAAAFLHNINHCPRVIRSQIADISQFSKMHLNRGELALHIQSLDSRLPNQLLQLGW